MSDNSIKAEIVLRQLKVIGLIVRNMDIQLKDEDLKMLSDEMNELDDNVGEFMQHIRGRSDAVAFPGGLRGGRDDLAQERR